MKKIKLAQHKMKQAESVSMNNTIKCNRKRLALASFLCLSMVMLAGCGGKAYIGTPDVSVDMSVRKIDLTNTSSVTEMLDKARSAVVGVSVDLNNGFVIGSGFAISDNGYIITNNHVIEEKGSITLYYADKTTGTGKVLWSDSSVDLAILKSSREIPYLDVTSSFDASVGEDVYAIGTPLTLQFKHTVTKGIISAKNRTLEVESDNGASFLQGLVQHDASINLGNSGGPLINSSGKVIGVNTLKASQGEGIGFASPIEYASAMLSRLRKNESFKAPYLGVFGFDNDIAQVYGESIGQDGVYVVSTDGPAVTSGLKKGDIITGINDQKIETMLELRLAILKYNEGDEVSITYIRNNGQFSTTLKLSKRA